ncbi:MAG: FHA domain-containing protein [Gammaproteobacteria bacterium]|nr:FHA domain-containing protein [Gammaproteobacteria bacterium]
MGWEILLIDTVRGDQTPRTFSGSVVRVGRNPDNELILKHSQISRLHLTLSKEGEEFFAQDSSSNGTFIKDATGSWQRLQGKVALQLPVTLRLADWTAHIEHEAEDDWDRSVIIPAGHLVKRVETVLVFDLCESSRLANENDHLALHLKTRLMQIAEPVLHEFGQRFTKGTGDGFLATFPSPTKALAAAVELVRRLQQRNSRTVNEPIHYRIALHFGEVWGISSGGEDIHGNDVNIAFRIEGAQAEVFTAPLSEFPRMNRLMCSNALLEEVRKAGPLPAAVDAIEIGPANLKGIHDPVRIFWLKTT